MDDGTTHEVIGSSIGGGQVLISRLDNMDIEFTAQSPAFFVTNKDEKGVISEITSVVAQNGINIAIMKLGRKSKGGNASCIIEVDGLIPETVADEIRRVNGVIDVRVVNIIDEG